MLLLKYMWPDGVISSLPTLLKVIYIGSHVKCSSDGASRSPFKDVLKLQLTGNLSGPGGLENTAYFSAA